MKKKMSLPLVVAFILASGACNSVAAQNFSQENFKNISYYAHRISETCDSIALYKKKTADLQDQYNQACLEIDRYCQKPFSMMTGRKVEAMPESKKYIKDAFALYNKAYECQKSKWNRENLEGARRDLTRYASRSNKDFQSLNESQKRDFMTMQKNISAYINSARDIYSLIQMKNNLLRTRIENGLPMNEGNWTKAKNNPWKDPNINEEQLNEFINKIQSVKEKYHDCCFVVEWLDKYKEMLFTKKVVPFTALPEKEFSGLYEINKTKIKVSKELLEMERQFIAE